MDAVVAAAHVRAARLLADARSEDPACKVAAVVVCPRSGEVLSAGVNAMCRGHRATPERWERPAKYLWVCHAELNAVADAARRGVAVDGAACVVTLFPCAAARR